MKQIPADRSRIITLEQDKWRILQNDSTPPIEIVKANTTTGLEFEETFAKTHHIPNSGQLSRNHVSEMVLGWSEREVTWKLGMVLHDQNNGQANKRWFELATWYDFDGTEMVDTVNATGETMAGVLGVPYQTLIPERIQVQDQTDEPLPSTPLSFGIWNFDAIDKSSDGEATRYLFQRKRQWQWRKIRRIVWYSLWCVVFLLVAIGTLSLPIDLPNTGTLVNPEWLPYMGIISAAILATIVIMTIYELISTPTKLLLNRNEQSVSSWVRDKEDWKIRADAVQAVVVSEVLSKRNRRLPISHGEINLQLHDDRYHHVLSLETAEDFDKQELLFEEKTTNLTTKTVSTPLQIAALYIARNLGDVPVYYDVRTR